MIDIRLGQLHSFSALQAVEDAARMKMRNFAVAASVILIGMSTAGGNAQVPPEAAIINHQEQNFTSIEKAACVNRAGRWCGLFDHHVCTLASFNIGGSTAAYVTGANHNLMWGDENV